MGQRSTPSCGVLNPQTHRSTKYGISFFVLGSALCHSLLTFFGPLSQFSHSVVSDSLWPHGLQHGRLPCPSPTSGACSNSCRSCLWCYPTISHRLLSPSPAFTLSQHQGLFQWVSSSGDQSVGVSASASVLPMNTQDWSPLVWTGWLSLQSKGLSRVFSNTTVQKHQFFGTRLFLWSNSHIYTWLLEKA